VTGLQSLPSGGRLYVTPSLTQQQEGQLVQALCALYTHDTQQQQPSTPPGPAAAAATEAVKAAAPTPAPAQAGCGTEPAAKRPRVEQQQQQQQQEEQQQKQQSDVPRVNIVVRDMLYTEVHFKVGRHVCIGKVLDAYCEKKSIDYDVCRFVFDGERLCNRFVTVQDLRMEDGDEIRCHLQQVGC
jgi:hypothetical protein